MSAIPEMTWLSLRRVLGDFRYAWAERRETAIATADGSDQTTRGVRGVVICRDERLTEIPFVIGLKVLLGKPRPAPARLSLEQLEASALPLLTRPGRAAPQPGLPEVPRAATIMEQRVARYWLWQGETFAEDEEIWGLIDHYDTNEESRMWRQRIVAGTLTQAAVVDAAESAPPAIRVAYAARPDWRPPVTLRFTGQAAATLAHELLGHYAENQLRTVGTAIEAPGIRVTYHPMMDGAITRRTVDDLGVVTSASGVHPLTSPSAGCMSLRTGSAISPEPWLGNMSVACAAEARCPHYREAITVTDVESACFRRGKKVIDMRIRCWQQDSAGESAASEAIGLTFDAAAALGSLHVEHRQADLLHGICKKGGLLNTYTVRTPPLVIIVPGAPTGSVWS